MKASTGEHYRKRLTRVVDYIYQHIDHDLDVNTLADVAALSPYHFHRIYRQIAGEPVNVTVRRLRLHHAAGLLIQSDWPISRIASKTAYSSSEAFGRAFRAQFGETPADYRRSRQQQPVKLEPFIAMLAPQPEMPPMYTVEITENPAAELLAVAHQGCYLNIGQAFEKLYIFAATKQLLGPTTRSVGIYYQDPDSVPESELRSHACISSDDAQSHATDGIDVLSLPGGRCASLVFKGPYAELEKAYAYLFGQWLPNSGEEMADFPAFEEYLNDPKNTPVNELLTRINCYLK